MLSLVSAAAGQNPNLCGILGGAAAAAADGLFGFQAYVLAILVLILALRVWSGAPGRTLVRESLGGAVLLIALSVGAGLFADDAQSAGGRSAPRSRPRWAAISTWAAVISPSCSR